MELRQFDSTELLWPSCTSSIPSPSTHSTKFLKETSKRSTRKPRSIEVPKYSTLELQKSSKKDLSRILRTEAAIEAIERKANSSKYNNLWPKAVLEALDDAIKDNRWESALKIFGLLRNQRYYEPRSQTYAQLLVMLGKSRQPQQASLLFEVMMSDGLQPTIDVYTALMSAYGFSGCLDQAFQILDDMKSVTDCKPDVHTYSILLKCCIRYGRFDLVEWTLSDMSYLGIQWNTVTYNILIDGFGKAGIFHMMERSLTNMIECATCNPDIFTFNSVIGVYGNSGHIQKMERWFEEFQLMGIGPDVMTFNILIKSYGKAKMYEKMRSVLDYMSKRFFSPTIVTYNTLIETFGKAGNIEKMDELFLELKHRGIKPNSITYCSLISAYAKAIIMKKVDSIMRQVENSDVVLDTPFFNCAICAYGQAGDVKKMAELFLQMGDRGCKPDNVTFATMVRAYNSLGMIDAAKEMEKKKLAANDN